MLLALQTSPLSCGSCESLEHPLIFSPINSDSISSLDWNKPRRKSLSFGTALDIYNKASLCMACSQLQMSLGWFGHWKHEELCQ